MHFLHLLRHLCRWRRKKAPNWQKNMVQSSLRQAPSPHIIFSQAWRRSRLISRGLKTSREKAFSPLPLATKNWSGIRAAPEQSFRSDVDWLLKLVQCDSSRDGCANGVHFVKSLLFAWTWSMSYLRKKSTLGMRQTLTGLILTQVCVPGQWPDFKVFGGKTHF